MKNRDSFRKNCNKKHADFWIKNIIFTCQKNFVDEHVWKCFQIDFIR